MNLIFLLIGVFVGAALSFFFWTWVIVESATRYPENLVEAFTRATDEGVFTYKKHD